MANCPACGCQISSASRFCPMCGVTVKEDAVRAQKGELNPVDPVQPPRPDDELIRSYAGLNRCGAGVIRALRVLAAVLTIVIALCGIVYGILLLVDGSTLRGVISLILGPGVGLLLYVIMTIGIILYENISFIARYTETQNRISAAQLELLSNMATTQNESLALARQSVELLKVMDGSLFDSAKLTERQTELLEKLVESQKANDQRMADLRTSSEQLAQTAAAHIRGSQNWRSSTRQFAHAIALAVAQLPDRIRDALSDAPQEPLPDMDEILSDMDAPSGEEESTDET